MTPHLADKRSSSIGRSRLSLRINTPSSHAAFSAVRERQLSVGVRYENSEYDRRTAILFAIVGVRRTGDARTHRTPTMTPTGKPVFSGAARGRPRVLNHRASIPHVYRVGVAFPEGPELLPFYAHIPAVTFTV